jgi:hypothetical protein
MTTAAQGNRIADNLAHIASLNSVESGQEVKNIISSERLKSHRHSHPGISAVVG